MRLRTFVNLYADLVETLRFNDENRRKYCFNLSISGDTGMQTITIKAMGRLTEEFVTKQPVEIMRVINSYGEIWVHYYDYFPSKGFADFGHKVALDVLNDYGDLSCDYDEVSADGSYKTNFLMLKEFD